MSKHPDDLNAEALYRALRETALSVRSVDAADDRFIDNSEDADNMAATFLDLDEKIRAGTFPSAWLKHRCGQCGGDRIEYKAHIDPNDGDRITWRADDPEDVWCEDCQEWGHGSAQTFKDLTESQQIKTQEALAKVVAERDELRRQLEERPPFPPPGDPE